jgi:hypothetical protein
VLGSTTTSEPRGYQTEQVTVSNIKLNAISAIHEQACQRVLHLQGRHAQPDQSTVLRTHLEKRTVVLYGCIFKYAESRKREDTLEMKAHMNICSYDFFI